MMSNTCAGHDECRYKFTQVEDEIRRLNKEVDYLRDKKIEPSHLREFTANVQGQIRLLQEQIESLRTDQVEDRQKIAELSGKIGEILIFIGKMDVETTHIKAKCDEICENLLRMADSNVESRKEMMQKIESVDDKIDKVKEDVGNNGFGRFWRMYDKYKSVRWIVNTLTVGAVGGAVALIVYVLKTYALDELIRAVRGG